MHFYLDTDFTCLWRCNLHLLNREGFSHSPGNSSSASDDLEGTERIKLLALVGDMENIPEGKRLKYTA